ncbi:MAG: PAS domain-containing protein [Ktedonobacteraceae bacterium]|nr:PAS domain-containing protein [Ktedonobacteraceae bacterium]
MGFAEFEQSISSPNLKSVARHWDEVRGGRRMPSWTDIRPAQIKAQLSIVWSYDYEPARDDFVGRLAGIAISGMSSGRFKGLRLSELRPIDQYPRALARARRVVKDPALYRGEGLVYKTANDFGFGERIALPISNDGNTADGIFGATEYTRYPSFDPSDPEARTEVEYWFSLN